LLLGLIRARSAGLRLLRFDPVNEEEKRPVPPVPPARSGASAKR